MRKGLRKLVWRGSQNDPGDESVIGAPSWSRFEPRSRSEVTVSPPVDGVEVWHEPTTDAIVDICFVHGLAGHGNKTWTASGQTSPWPKELLPTEITNARILTYGYDAYVFPKSGSKASANQVVDHASNLLTDLTNARLDGDTSSRPLIFVAHSLGGLVCKQALLRSRNNPEAHLRGIFNSTKGIIFLGTPHRGSWMADMAKVPASALGLVKSINTSLLTALQADTQYLKSLQDDFLSMVRQQRESGRGLEVTCFFEELPLPRGGIVVSKDSATFDGYNPITIHADHKTMVKFNSVGDNGFKRLVSELKRWVSDIDEGWFMASADQTSTLRPRISAESTIRQPSVHHLPFSKNYNLVGRKDVLEHLRQRLLNGPGGQRLALLGLGGMGKTQTALQFSHSVKGSVEYGDFSVIWIPVLSMASFEQACATVVNKLNIKNASDTSNKKELFRDYFSSDESGKWLLILDNADDVSTMHGLLSKSDGIIDYLPVSDGGRTLLTTRSREVANSFAGSNVLELTSMSHEDATTLLERSLEKRQSLQEYTKVTDELLSELAYLPLAIAQASSYINMNSISVHEYLRLFRKTDQDMVELLSRGFRDGTHYSVTQGAVATTWTVSFNQIQSHDADAEKLLCFMAHIEPKAIPRSILPNLGTEQKMTHAIGTLCGYGFLSRQREGDVFDMHSLVYVSIRLWLQQQNTAESTYNTAIVHLSNLFQDHEWAAREAWRPQLTHVLKALQDPIGTVRESFILANTLSFYLLNDSRREEVIELLERMHALMDKQELPASESSRRSTQYLLGIAYQGGVQSQAAVDLLLRVVDTEKEILSEDNPVRLQSQRALANSYISNGQNREGINVLLQVRRVEDSLFEELDYRKASTLHHLALAYQSTKDYRQAIESITLAITMREGVYAKDDYRVLGAKNVLGILYREDGQADKAIEVLEDVFALRRATLEKDNIKLLVTQIELAIAYTSRGRFEDTPALLEPMIPLLDTTSGTRRHHACMALHWLAIAYHQTGRTERAVENMERAVAASSTMLSMSDGNRLRAEQSLQHYREELQKKGQEAIAEA